MIVKQSMDLVVRFVADSVDLRSKLLTRSCRVLFEQRLNPIVVTSRSERKHNHICKSDRSILHDSNLLEDPRRNSGRNFDLNRRSPY